MPTEPCPHGFVSIYFCDECWEKAQKEKEEKKEDENVNA